MENQNYSNGCINYIISIFLDNCICVKIPEDEYFYENSTSESHCNSKNENLEDCESLDESINVKDNIKVYSNSSVEKKPKQIKKKKYKKIKMFRKKKKYQNNVKILNNYIS